ncbi:hypothetical protein [Picosynechococcus sp. PCC 11901]|uniref:hypothetical protein n=1 Tax=Picosynechococcus sp. PCC 11901 TaxID=2579791 RepID=UPI00210792EC|nr:hypothetical protein [Picosynechococcus sp. PCC 11901]
MDQQLKDVLRRNATIPDVAIAIEENLDVVPSNILMAEEEIRSLGCRVVSCITEGDHPN